MHTTARLLAATFAAILLPAAPALASGDDDDASSHGHQSITAAPSSGFDGAYWDADGVADLAAALDIIASEAPRASFVSTRIDYPSGSTATVGDETRLEDFLGADAASLSGSGSRELDGSVFRFSGMVDLGGGEHVFQVGSDDGFQLSIGGSVIGAFSGLRSFADSSFAATLAAGPLPFELIYFENFGVTGIELRIDGVVANGAMLAVSAVPEPGHLPLYLAGLGVMGMMVRRRSE